MGFKCEFCNKEFKRDSTAERHECEKKARWNGRKEKSFRRGLHYFDLWHKMNCMKGGRKSSKEFACSPYYGAFMKFSNFIGRKNRLHRTPYFEWLLRKNHGVDHWTRETLYRKHLAEKYRTETAEDAAERLILHLEAWRERNGESQWSDYFTKAPDNRIYMDVKNGTVSPWMFLCIPKLKKRIFTDMPEQLVSDMFADLDMTFWKRKIGMSSKSVKWVRETLG